MLRHFNTVSTGVVWLLAYLCEAHLVVQSAAGFAFGGCLFDSFHPSLVRRWNS